MPLSCKGRYRGSETDRGDIDESLGKYVIHNRSFHSIFNFISFFINKLLVIYN